MKEQVNKVNKIVSFPSLSKNICYPRAIRGRSSGKVLVVGEEEIEKKRRKREKKKATMYGRRLKGLHTVRRRRRRRRMIEGVRARARDNPPYS